MVNVTAVIFFGKSEKNIWVLDFFNYNHWYETVKQSKQSAQFITDLFMEQYHSRTDTTAITWNGITAKQLSQIKQSNRTTAKYYFCGMELYHGRMGNE